MSVTAKDGLSSLDLDGVAVEIRIAGQGRPLLFLHPGHPSGTLAPDAPLFRLLAAGSRIVAPIHPGFGETPAPRSLTTVDDLAYLYLDLLDALDLRDAVLVGASLGGWIAAEIAVKSTARIAKLILVDPVGIKVGDRETRDIADIYALTNQDLAALAFADKDYAARDVSLLPETELQAMARSRESSARYSWSPYMHNPKLKARLHRIGVPTLVLWGAQDRITAPDYGRAYAAAIPGARFELIEGAGHFPHLDRPDALAGRISSFIAG